MLQRRSSQETGEGRTGGESDSPASRGAPRNCDRGPCPQARSLQAVPKLVKLFNHANQEVQRHATGATRNLIYDNADNKLALVEENGIFELLRTLREQDDELRKNVTGQAGSSHPAPSGPGQPRLDMPKCY